MSDDALDGCEIDFTKEPPTKASELEALLVPAGSEVDEDDD